MAPIDGAEVAKHNTKKSCWIVLDSNVYDVTSFLTKHPGGAAILLKQGGSDATEEFKKYHPLSYIQDLPPDSLLGPLDPNTFAQLRTQINTVPEPNKVDKDAIPHVTLMNCLSDFESAAKKVLPNKPWIYASSSANAGLSIKQNFDDWGRVTFRPRVLRNVGGEVNMKRKILGYEANYPFYISPMGTMGALHPGAEPEMVKGGVVKGVHVVVSTASTKSCTEIMESYQEVKERVRGPTELFFQFYMPVDRNKALELLGRVKKLGYKGLWITVDTPVLGKRLADRYLQAEEALAVGLEDDDDDLEKEEQEVEAKAQKSADWEAKPPNENPDGSSNGSAATNSATSQTPTYQRPTAVGGRPSPGFLSPHTTWQDLEWIRKEWQGPIVLKGVQCVEDAKLAVEYGCQGILLSNHGGRQLHSAPSALMTLVEIRAYAPEVFDKLEIYVDGGLRDGSDILKALCLGATAVGVGRPFLYALAAYGRKGVGRVVDVLQEELDIGMRLLGVTSLDQLRPEMVNAQRLLSEMWRPDSFPATAAKAKL